LAHCVFAKRSVLLMPLFRTDVTRQCKMLTFCCVVQKSCRIIRPARCYNVVVLVIRIWHVKVVPEFLFLYDVCWTLPNL